MGHTQEFFQAIMNGDLERVLGLLDDDAMLANACTSSGLSAVLLACYYHEPQIAALIAERTARVDLFEAAALGNFERVAVLLSKEPQTVNRFSNDGFQAIHLAAFFGHPDIVALLLEHGAEANTTAQNAMKVKPLHSAVAARHLEVSRILLEHGADVNARQAEDTTPLQEAAQNGQLEMLDLLLTYGADLLAEKADGKTALDLASEQGHAQAVEKLKSAMSRS